MRGYVVKKGKSYYAVVYDGVDPGTGKEKRKWVSAGPRRSDAEKLVTDLVKRRNQGVSVATEKLTLGEYLTGRWLPIQESQIRKSTFDSYRRNIELHVLPALAKMPLEKLTASDLDALYASLLVRGRKAATRTGEGLAPKTVRSIHLVVHKALADAERKGLVIRNVAALADPPKVGARKQIEIKAWTAEQLDVFLEAIEAHRLAPAFHLASYTGMRRGELLGLRWKDLDLDANRLSVRQALVSVAYEMHISDVKTGSGRRTIDIEEETVEVLRQWRKARELEAGGPIGEEALVFSKPDTTWIHPDVFSQTFDRVVARIAVPEITLHDLRHTHATLLLQAGVSVKVVCERLGHSNPAFTMSVYQHVLPGMQAEAAVAFAQVLRNAHMVRTAMGTAVATVNGPSGKVTPLGVDGVLEALGGIEDPSTMAEIAAEAVRMMNRATLAAPSAGTVGWQDVGDTYRLLGELGVLVDRLPQVCDQLARTFQRPAFRSSTRSDSETSETATSLLAVAADEMVRADEYGRALGRCIAAAHAAVSHLAPLGDDTPVMDTSTEATVVAESGEGGAVVTSDVNVIEVLGHDLLLVETSGAEVHLASLCDGDDRRAAVKATGAEYVEPPEVVAGYDQAALYRERWSPKTLCGRGWVEMAAGDGGTFRRWQVISLVPTCRSCLRVIDTWFAPVEAPDGMELLASVVADTVETFGCSRVVGAPVEHVEALRRAIRKHLRARGYRAETHHVNGVVHVFSEGAYAAIAPDVLAERDREVAARIGQIISGIVREPARLQDQPDVVLWSTWVLDL